MLTSEQVIAQQKKDAERALTTVKNGGALAIPNKDFVTAYLDEIAPASIVGRMAKFSGKAGGFITADDEKMIDESAEFVVLADQTLVGWVKFNDDGPPDRRMGLLYDGFVMPSRESLGDTDPGEWEPGLAGRPTDPWQHHAYLVMQNTGTEELLTFVTSSSTGRRAVGNLLRHYERMLRIYPQVLPVVKLKKGGFQHQDDRIGFVPTPVFAVVGRVPRDSAVTPDTSPAADMNDDLPF